MKKSTNLESKIKAYSAMALCFAGAGVASGQVVYTDVNPDKVITTPPDSLKIDFNTDGTSEYVIKRFNWGGNASNPAVIMPPTVGNAIMATMGTVIPYVSALANGTAIGAAATTWIENDGVDPQLAKMGLASTYSGQQYGNFNDGQEHYVGCKFNIGGNTHYGWVRVQCVSGGGSATIKDYAYQSTANTAINAGEMPSGIDNANGIEMNIYAFNKNIHLNFSVEINGEINVYNAIGEVVLTEKMEGAKKVVNMSAMSAGVYMVTVKSERGTFVKKVNL